MHALPAQSLDGAPISSRALVLMAIVGFHGLLVYVLASGLGPRAIRVVDTTTVIEILRDKRPRDIPPPPPEPGLKPQKIDVPQPVVVIDDASDRPTAIKQIITGPVGPVAPPQPHRESRIPPRLGKHFPNPDDYYPPGSIRLEEQGGVTVRVCVGPNGRVAQAPTIVTSSGSARLDEAAIKLARAGRYSAGSIDGIPTTDCLALPVRFRLKN